MTQEIKHFERPTSQRPSSLVSVVVVSACVGLAMGAAGFTLMKSLYPSDTILYGASNLNPLINRTTLDNPFSFLASHLKDVTGSLYRLESTEQPLFLSSNYLGSAVVATSDGWFLFVGDARVSHIGQTEILLNRKRYLVKDVHFDQRLGISFLKAEAVNLTPISFYRQGYPEIGSVVVTYDAPSSNSATFVRTVISESNSVNRTSKQTLQISSADVHGIARLAEQKSNSFYYDTGMSLLGFSNDKGTLIPSYLVEQSLLAVLSERQVANLGIVYQELYRDPLEDKKGIQITTKPVISTPAAKAGLQVGDIILAIDGKALTLDYTFAQSQAHYFVGDRVTLQIQRNGQISDIEVVF